jgi:uncharacterized protein (DUF885 family)
MAIVLLAVAVVMAVVVWFVFSLVRGRPWSIQLLYARTFLGYALKDPELLTMLGILEHFGLHGHNARLTDASEAFQDRMAVFVQRDLAILRRFPRSRQNPSTLLSTDIMDYFLDDQIRSDRFRHHTYPLNQMFGIQSELPNFMLTMHPVVSPLEARNYLRRLGCFGIKFDQVLVGLAIRAQMGCIPPRFVIQRVLDEMTTFIGRPARENPLYTVFRDKLDKVKHLSPVQRERLLARAEAEITRTVYPAYQKLIACFGKLEAGATTDDGIWKLPDGAAYYAHCLRSNTTTDFTPEQVHAIGLQEVARIEVEMVDVLEKLGMHGSGSPSKLMNGLSLQERFLYPNSNAGRAQALEDYQRILDEVNAALGPYFSIRPRAGLKVERIPEFREKTSAGAYYQPGDMGGNRPGVFFANLRDMQEVHKFGMKTLAYHEGIPGHHFQIAIAQELRDVPFFRRMVPFTAYAEGWALYAEKLAREIGMYRDDPYGELGYLDSELFRAVRLVVDTGIHFKKWTREQAIEYMDAHTSEDHASVVSEIERYIVMPGQACAYKIGEIKIVELREKAKKELGARFDLCHFHDLVLKNGAMPLSILEQVIEADLAGTKDA